MKIEEKLELDYLQTVDIFKEIYKRPGGDKELIANPRAQLLPAFWHGRRETFSRK